MTYPYHYDCEALVAATPEVLFDFLDDPHRLAGHMSRRSIAMAGAFMKIETDAQRGRALGSLIRMHARVMGIPVSLEEIVVERKRPSRKAWVTAGQPRLLVIGQYRMGFRISPAAGGSHLAVFIDYRWPSNPWLRVPAWLLAASYARWCCRQMVRDARKLAE